MLMSIHEESVRSRSFEAEMNCANTNIAHESLHNIIHKTLAFNILRTYVTQHPIKLPVICAHKKNNFG